MKNYSQKQLKIFKNDKRYTENGFFNLKGYIEECVGEDWENKSFSMIIQAERNMGKSYGTWDFIEKEIWIKSNYTQRIAYLRTNATKLKSIKSFFNSKYAGKYLMTDTHIWKIELDDNGKEIREKRIELGAVIGVMNEENWRSGEFANYRLIFWDEYNENMMLDGIYEHWVNLFKTIERMSKNFIAILVGNKISANNDILVNLEIEVNEEDDDFDTLQTRPYNSDNPSIFFLNIGKKTFAHLSQEEKLANIWATFNTKTNTFLNEGGYLEKKSYNILFYSRIQESATIKNYVVCSETLFEYGSFEKGFYFHKVEQAKPNYNIFALDIASSLSFPNSKKYMGMEDYVDFARLLANHAKNQKLFFTSYEAYRKIFSFIKNFSTLAR